MPLIMRKSMASRLPKNEPDPAACLHRDVSYAAAVLLYRSCSAVLRYHTMSGGSRFTTDMNQK